MGYKSIAKREKVTKLSKIDIIYASNLRTNDVGQETKKKPII